MATDPLQGSAPETVTEAVALLRANGYEASLELLDGHVVVDRGPDQEPVSSAIVDHTFRFEGDSDPADEAIVLGVHCPGLGVRGVVVSAYGPAIDPEHAALLEQLIEPEG